MHPQHTLHCAAELPRATWQTEAAPAVVLAVLGALVLRATGIAALPWLMVGFFAAGFVVTALRVFAVRWKVLARLELLALLVLLVCMLLMRTGFTDALAQAQNVLRDTLAARRGLLIPLAVCQSDAACWLLGVVLGTLAALLCRALCKIPALAATVCLLFAALSAYWLSPDAACIAACGICAVWLLTQCGWHGRAPLSGTVLVLPVIVLVLGICWTTDLPDTMQAVSRRAQTALHSARYESAAQTLPEGALDRTLPEVSSATQLMIASDGAQDLYLRGFVGDSYTDGVWSALDPALAAEEKDLFYWLHRGGFDPQSQLALAASCKETVTLDRLTIRTLNACSAYRYQPYGVTQQTNGVQDNRLQPSAVSSDGAQRYTLSVLTDSAAQIAPLLQFLQTDTSADTQSYLQQESVYRAFVQSYALDVSEEFIVQYGAMLAQYGTPGQDTAQAQRSAQAFLTACFDADTPLMLRETAGGSVYQYVTLGVLALRYYGIPARYCEGYFVSAAALQDGEAAVTGADAGAWIEVYQDGLGWLPADVTPGFEGLAAQQSQGGTRPAGAGQDADADGLRVPEGEELQQEELPQQSTPQPQPENGSDAETGLVRTLLAILLVVLILVAAVLLRHSLRLRRRWRRLSQVQTHERAALVYAEVAAMLERMGLSRAGGSMLPVCARAETRFGAEYGAALRTLTAVNARALFSSRGASDTDCEQMQALRAQTLKLLKSNTNIMQRFKMRWLECLY